MIIRCWGARGSIPVSGEEYLKYGGDTTCIEVRTKHDEVIIIDAGSGIRRLGHRLMAEDRFDYVMIFTHAHWDHIMGFPFFKPIYSRRTHIAMYGCAFAQTSMRQILSPIMAPPHFPVQFEDIRADITYHESSECPFLLKSMEINTIALSHPNGGVGYKFTEDGKSFIFLTDNELSHRHEGGLPFQDYLAFCRDADLLFHDAEYTEEDYGHTRGWGHSLYGDALRLALEANVKRLGLFHHNQERSDQGIDGILADCKTRISQDQSALDCMAVQQGLEIRL